jgi:hypothetical protein
VALDGADAVFDLLEAARYNGGAVLAAATRVEDLCVVLARASWLVRLLDSLVHKVWRQLHQHTHHIAVNIYLYIYIYASIYTYEIYATLIYIYIYVYVYVYVYICMYDTYVVCIYTYIHMCVYI